MVIGLNKLLQMVSDPSIKLIENLSDRESHNPEGVVFDLRLGEIYLTSKTEGGYLGLDERSTPNANLIVSYQEGKVKKIEVKRGEFIL